MFVCERCGSSFKRKNNFIRHLNRKYICKPIKSNISVEEIIKKNKLVFKSEKKYECEFCKKKYTRKNNLTKHKLSCNKQKIVTKSKDKDYWKELFEKSEQQKEKLIRQEKQEKLDLINIFRKEKQDFMNQIELLLTKVGNNNITNIQQNNIIIRNFGEEDLSYLNNKFFKTLFVNNKPINTIPTIVKNIYFNYEHPENMNLKIVNTNQPYINVYKEDKWQKQNKKDTINKIVNKNFNLIDTKFTLIEEELPEKNKQSYKEYKNEILEKSEKSKEFIKDIVKKTENIILVSS